MKIYLSYKSMPEVRGLASDEAERRYKRAYLNAQKLVEDSATKNAIMVWAVLGGSGGVIGGVHGALGAAIGAVSGCLLGGLIGEIYRTLALKAKAQQLLRECEVGRPVAAAAASPERE